MAPRNLIVAGAWFMAREVELSNARAMSVTLHKGSPTVRPSVTWSLPASKADAKATGVSRTHACVCAEGRPTPRCPVHALWDHLICLRRCFPGRWHGGVPAHDLPLFPTSNGQPCDKERVTLTLVRAAGFLGMDEASADGTERVTGHSLRTTGAQGLARAGVSLWAIQLVGRWGSDVVKSYVRDAHVTQATHEVSTMLGPRTEELETLVDRLVTAKLKGLKQPASSTCGSQGDVVKALENELREPLEDEVRIAEADLSAEDVPDTGGASSSSDRPSGEASLAPSSCTSPPCSSERAPRFAVNHTTGVVHRVAVFQGAELSQWTTACGWHLGRHKFQRISIIQAAEVPTGYKRLCEKCLPELRAQRKLADRTAMVGQVGEGPTQWGPTPALCDEVPGSSPGA